MNNICRTMLMTFILGMDNRISMKWYIDVSFSLLSDRKRHTRAIMAMGKIAVYEELTKQKFNTSRFT